MLTLENRALKIWQYLLLILVYLLGSVGFGVLVENEFKLTTPIFPAVACGFITGVLATLLEALIFTYRGFWPQKRLTFLSRMIIWGTIGVNMSYTLASAILYQIECTTTTDPLVGHMCGGPPLFVKGFFVFITVFPYAFPIGTVVGLVNYFTLSLISTTLPDEESVHTRTTLTDFSTFDRLGGIGCFGILLATPMLIADFFIIGGVTLLISLILLGYALVMKFRTRKSPLEARTQQGDKAKFLDAMAKISDVDSSKTNNKA